MVEGGLLWCQKVPPRLMEDPAALRDGTGANERTLGWVDLWHHRSGLFLLEILLFPWARAHFHLDLIMSKLPDYDSAIIASNCWWGLKDCETVWEFSFLERWMKISNSLLKTTSFHAAIVIIILPSLPLHSSHPTGYNKVPFCSQWLLLPQVAITSSRVARAHAFYGYRPGSIQSNKDPEENVQRKKKTKLKRIKGKFPPSSPPPLSLFAATDYESTTWNAKDS